MNGMNTLKRDPFPLLPCQDTERRKSSVSQEGGSHLRKTGGSSPSHVKHLIQSFPLCSEPHEKLPRQEVREVVNDSHK